MGGGQAGTGSLPSGGLSGPAGGGSPSTNVLADLANDPNFQQLRAAIRNNPQMLQNVLAVIAQNNPQLFNVSIFFLVIDKLQLITQNQEAFTKLLLEGDGGEGGIKNLFKEGKNDEQAKEVQEVDLMLFKLLPKKKQQSIE